MTRHQPGRRVGFSPIRTTAGPRVLFTGRRPPVIGPAAFDAAGFDPLLRAIRPAIRAQTKSIATSSNFVCLPIRLPIALAPIASCGQMPARAEFALPLWPTASGRPWTSRTPPSGLTAAGDAYRAFAAPPAIDTDPVAVATASSRAATRKVASVADNSAVGPEGPFSTTLPCALTLPLALSPAENEVSA